MAFSDGRTSSALKHGVVWCGVVIDRVVVDRNLNYNDLERMNEWVTRFVLFVNGWMDGWNSYDQLR